MNVCVYVEDESAECKKRSNKRGRGNARRIVCKKSKILIIKKKNKKQNTLNIYVIIYCRLSEQRREYAFVCARLFRFPAHIYGWNLFESWMWFTILNCILLIKEIINYMFLLTGKIVPASWIGLHCTVTECDIIKNKWVQWGQLNTM